MNMFDKIVNLFYLLVSIILNSAFFAIGTVLLLGAIGLAADFASPARGFDMFFTMLKLAVLAGIVFSLELTFYVYYIDKQRMMPALEPDEHIRFRQYGYVITDQKYDPARIVVTDRRLLVLPTHFNDGPVIPDFLARLSEISIKKDRSFGAAVAGRFLPMKFKNKLVINHGDTEIGYMPNIGYSLPPANLFTRC